MTTFDPAQPALVRDLTNGTVRQWPGVTQAQWKQGASWHRLADGSRAVNWQGLLLEGWQPIDDVTPRLPLPMKANAATLRFCYAVALATRVKVGRWAAISEVIEMLPVIDQADDDTLIAAAVASGLVTINPGPIAHSIALTAAGLDVCRSMAEPERKRRPPRPKPERAV
jgi:hypothetical protein